jgi:hypothetical protein
MLAAVRILRMLRRRRLRSLALLARWRRRRRRAVPPPVALGIERIGLISLRFPLVVGLLTAALATVAAFGIGGRCDHSLTTTANALEPILQNLINRVLRRLSAVRRLRSVSLILVGGRAMTTGRAVRRARHWGVDCRRHRQGPSRESDQQCHHSNLQNGAHNRQPTR